MRFGKSPLFSVFGILGLTLLVSCAGMHVKVEEAPTSVHSLSLLRTKIDSLLSSPLFRQTQTGIEIYSLNRNRVLYARNSHILFNPASNMKLLTTALALKTLGPDFRFKTLLLADSATVRDSSVTGNLYLKGGADPDLISEELQDLIDQLEFRGIREIDGNLIADATFLDSLPRGKGWMWDDDPDDYAAHLSALSLNDNCVDVLARPGNRVMDSVFVFILPETHYVQLDNRGVTGDSTQLLSLKISRRWLTCDNTITVRDTLPISVPKYEIHLNIEKPSLYAATVFAEMLGKNGIRFHGQIFRGTAPTAAETLAVHSSHPLREVIENTNKISDNLSAELLLKTVGAVKSGLPGTSAKGIQALKDFLQQVGIDSSSFYVTDGSGVSRYDVIYADLLVKLLAFMYRDFAVGHEYLASLPIAGVDGTIQNRMRGTAAQGILRAKTGSLRGVSSLSGYVPTSDGDVLAFSILMQNFIGSAAPYRAAQDSIGVWLAKFRWK